MKSSIRFDEYSVADMRDESVWADLYGSEAGKLWRSVLLFSGNREIASDAVAEAFAQAIARGAAIQDPRAWIWKASFNIARGELARSRKTIPMDKYVDPPAERQDLVDLMSALDELSNMQRGAVVLHYYDGYQIAEVAAIMGTSRSAVGVHLFRARAKLRQQMGGES